MFSEQRGLPCFPFGGPCSIWSVKEGSDRSDRSNSHHGPAEEADEDHEKPARDCAEGIDDIACRDQKSPLRKPAIRSVEGALVRAPLLIGLLRVNLVKGLGRYSCRVEVHIVLSGGRALLADLSRDLEVRNRRRTSGPSRA